MDEVCMIVLRALGKAEIETGTTTLTPSQEMLFAAALYLILESGKHVSRQILASLLWPQVAELARSHRLRQTILQLKKVGLVAKADRNTLQFSRHDCKSDVAELTEASRDALAAHASLEFLPGYSPTFSESFRDWVDAQREAANAQVTRRLVTELNTARSKGDWSACDRFARQCLKLDPFNESAVLAQAEASAMRGAKTQAIEIIDRYLAEVGSDNPNLRVSASVLRRRITDRIPERTSITVRESAFVGRDAEMETLTRELVAARHGKGGARLVRGEAGIGKSRLASELVKFATLEGIQTSRTTCRRSDVDRPLSVFVDLVPQFSELRGALGCSQETMSVLRGLTEFDGRSAFSSLSVDDAISAHTRMRSALFDLLDAVADERTVLIVVDDVQWLDASSVRLFLELLPWAKNRKVFFVLTERFGTKGLASHFSQDDLRMLTLGPLGSQFGEAIMTEILKESARPTTSQLIQRLLSVAEGNPFFLQELGNHWLETGKQRETPPSVTAVIDERLARLSAEALMVLQACAVLDVNATIERVEGVLEFQSHVLLSAIQELSVAAMLRTEAQSPAESAEPLAVGHDLISTAALQRLAGAPLAFLHRRAGTVLERETRGDAARTAMLWACAFHWQHAGDRERALRAACSCAEHLLEVGLTHDAAQAFERARAYCVTDEQQLLVLSRLAKSLQVCGLWDQSKDVLHKARHLQAKTAPNATTHDDVELALFETRWRASVEHIALLDDLKACVKSDEASVSHRITCGLLAIKIASEQSQIDALRSLYLMIVPFLNDPGISPAIRLEVEMVYHSSCGDMQEAERGADQLRKIACEDRDPRTRSGALCNVGAVYRRAGRTDDATALFLEALELSIKHGLVGRTSFAIFALVRIYIANGEILRARAALQKLEGLAEVDQSVHRTADRLYFLARLALEEGNLKEAAERYSALIAKSYFPGAQWRAAVLALGVRIAIRQEASVNIVRAMVSELEAVHLHSRGMGSQDFEAHALALGVRYCGEPEESVRLLTEYTTEHRLEKWALPHPIVELLRELQPTGAVLTVCETESLSGVV
jgi:DNA-binding SARP family transcriptional activator/tetratricopeptide (TPR) repeat protein